jgi:cell division protein FtsQ
MRFLSRLAADQQNAAQQRLQPVRRGRRLPRRWREIVGAVLFAAAIGGAGYWLQRSGVALAAYHVADARVAAIGGDIGLSVASVEVEGREHESREAILDALDVRRGSPILALDPAEAKARLEALPWVRSAAVERQMPDTIRVRLVERRPLAFWQRNNKLVLVDADGTVLATDHLDGYGTLLVLVGDDAPAQCGALRDILTTEPALATRVEAAVRVGGRRWNLRLDNGLEVELPELDAAGAWHRLAEAEQSSHVLERNILSVDLRLPDRLGVRLVPEPPKEATVKKARPGAKST